MKHRNLWMVFGLAGCLSLLLAGCGSDEDSADAAPDAEAVAGQPAAAAEVPQQVKAHLNAYDQAVQKDDYETAANSLLQVEFSQAPLNQQQAFDQVNRMRELSRAIANAAANGDPRAQRAAELLRRAQQYRMATGAR